MRQPVRLYSDQSHYDRSHRSKLFSFLRPFWKDRPITEEERFQTYGLTCEDFVLVPSMNEADLVILPMSWNYYVKRKRISQACGMLKEARKANKILVAHTSGDFGITLPAGWDDVFVLRQSGYKSRRRPREMATPVFISDPLPLWSEGMIPKRDKGIKPVVGFCGMMTTSGFSGCYEVLRNLGCNVLTYCRMRHEDPQSLYSATLLRGRALSTLLRDGRIEANFILRRKYRAGAKTPEERRKTTAEFFANIRNSDYTVCMRGVGNFSVRFYETLAMGRIPLFINTDCSLPFDEQIDWKRYILSCEKHDLQKLPERVLDDYGKLDDESLFQRFKNCRHLWEEWLSFGAYHKKIASVILNGSW